MKEELGFELETPFFTFEFEPLDSNQKLPSSHAGMPSTAFTDVKLQIDS